MDNWKLSSPEPLVSVLLPLKNAERWIGDALASLVRQTYERIEIIVIDNGSADRSPDIVQAFDDSRVVFLSQRSGFLVSALNLGYAHISRRAEIIARQDADDLSTPTRIEAQLQMLASNDQIALVGAAHLQIDINGGVQRVVAAYVEPCAVRARLRRGMPFAGPSIVAHRGLFDALGGYDPAFDGRLGEDYDFLVRAAEIANLSAVAEPLYVYRTENPASMCGAVGYDYREAKTFVRDRALLRRSAIFSNEGPP